jgi:DNA-binding NtrC family response regulator
MNGDKRALLDYFRRRYADRAGAQPFELDETAARRWQAYEFPGNVRELRNIVIRLATKYAGQRVSPADLEAEFDLELEGDPAATAGAAPASSILEQATRLLERGGAFSLDETLKAWERAYIEAALRLTRGNVSQAAKMLGVNRTTLYSRMSSGEEK